METCKADQTMAGIWQRVETQGDFDRPLKLRARWKILVKRERGIAVESGLFDSRCLSDTARSYIKVLYLDGFKQTELREITGCSRMTIGGAIGDSLLPQEAHYRLRLQIIRDEELVGTDGKVSTADATTRLGISHEWLTYLVDERGLEFTGYSAREVALPLTIQQIRELSRLMNLRLLAKALTRSGHNVSGSYLSRLLRDAGLRRGRGRRNYPVTTVNAAVELIQPMLVQEP